MATAGLAPAVVSAQGAAKIVVVGGGFAGVACARAIARLDPTLQVTLVAGARTFSASPMNSLVIAGLREPAQQDFAYDRVAAAGMRVVTERATAVDPAARLVTLAGGDRLAYDRLVIAPGVEMNFKAIPGYTEAAIEKMPHAWTGGAQAVLLRDQLAAMPDGGLVVIAAPATPYRCPPAPYERASLIAHYLKVHKPKSKVLILDAKDGFSKQHLFEEAWASLYPGLIERVSLSKGGSVTAVDPATMTVKTDFDDYKAAVANIVPPQRAATIAARAGVADRTGWCPVEPLGFESTLQPGMHVLGDAALMGAMPKAAHAAAVQGRVCAAAVAARLRERPVAELELDNVCYSLAGPDWGFVETNKYRPEKALLTALPGAIHTSPAGAARDMRTREASDDVAWFGTLTGELFG
jgi:NADPH-dependent 2,4-dienoyl-CoA reductase/sulfur reductase-like enzyme